MDALRSAAKTMGEWDEAIVAFDRRGGDGWQIAMAQPLRAFRAAVYLQACLRRMDKRYATRIALSVSKGTLPEGPNPDPNAAHGPAFTRSGHLLEKLGPHSLMGHARGGAQQAAIVLADYIAQGWTQAQARAVAEQLVPKPGPRSEAAKRLGISRQAVDQALWAAGFPAIDAAIQAWEDI